MQSGNNGNRRFINVPADPSKSAKAQNPLLRVKYKREVAQYGQSEYFILLKTDQGDYRLAPGHTKSDSTPIIPHGEYNYIIEDADGKPFLKISKDGHFFLANESKAVFAAGTITFQTGELITFDGEAGTYYYDLNGMKSTPRRTYKSSLTELFQEIGMPIDKYNFDRFKVAEEASAKKKIQQYNRCRLFYCAGLTIAALITGGAIAYQVTNNN